ncbi:MAG: cytochrome P450 [Nocardioidaceae bacterium]
MLDTRPRVKEWLGRRLVARMQRRGLNLARLPMVPESLTMPLRRNGLDPVPELGRIRAAEPVHKLGRLLGKDIWLVTGHDEVEAVLASISHYSNDIRPMLGARTGTPEDNIGGLGFTDPPDHTRLRRILTPEFTKRRLERLRPEIAKIIEHQLDVVEDAGPMVDLVPTFAFPVPFLVICELLGLPDEEREAFQRIGHARFDVSNGGVGVFGAASESRSFLLESTRKQRKHPGDGLIGMIIKKLGDEIDDVELSGLADGVLTGGFETTASMLALGTTVLLQDPERFAALRDNDQVVEQTVEELLRYLTVVQVAFPRFARHDLELFGKRISAGDVVACSLIGADRDARLGATMDDFDPDRGAVPHLAFGHGFHRCVGAELARMELRAAFPALERRFPTMRLATELERMQFRDLSLVYGLDALPVQAW